MSSGKGKKFLIIFVLLLIVGLTGTYFYYAEAEPPRINLIPSEGAVRKESPVRIALDDDKSGLSRLFVEVVQQGKGKTVVLQDFGQSVHHWQTEVFPGQQNVEDGSFVLRVTARDRSWKNVFKGNGATREFSFVLDSQAPRINLETFRHNLNQGGAGLVSFKVTEPVQKAGVKIGQYFFPAYQGPKDRYFCLFGFPHDVDPGQGKPLIQAKDQAGNRKEVGFTYHINSQHFARTRINIPEQFLQTKMVHFQDVYPEVDNQLELFLKVNQELRVSNRELLKQIGLNTAPKPLWSGRFLRPKGARRSGFASHRTYFYQGQEIDRQTHLGVDIASLARANVRAANSGRVVFSDWLGIYGQVIIIDHGLGLQTLYAHLSERKAAQGEQVEKGGVIGRTGATGLAGGDHLHFAVLLSGLPVNPIEWWDQNWVQNNIEGKLSGLGVD